MHSPSQISVSPIIWNEVFAFMVFVNVSVVEQVRPVPSVYSILPVASIVKSPGIISVYPRERILNLG